MLDMYTITMADSDDAEEISRLMHRVHDEMERPDLFVCDDLPYVQQNIKEEGFCLIAKEAGGTIVGSLIVHFPGMADNNLGRDISLPDEELIMTAHMESAVVSKEARGHHLLLRLMTEAEKILRTRGMRHVLGTVSPENPASFRNFETLQYRLVKTTLKYGGLVRRIYYKELM